MSASRPSAANAIDELLSSPPAVHLGGTQSWALESQSLRWLAASLKPEWRTIETGCGSSSIVFMVLGTEHTIVAPNASEHQATRQWCEQRGFPTDRTTSIVADSTQALPTLEGEFDLGLIDGGHAFPLPFVDWLYVARLLRVGGLVIVDDTNLPTCGILDAFLNADTEHWQPVERFDRTSVYRKLTGVVVSPADWTGQPWVLAELARRRTLGARVTARLKRSLRSGGAS